MTPDDVDRMVAAGFSVEELAGAVKLSLLSEIERRERRRARRSKAKARPEIPRLTELRGGMFSETITHGTRMWLYGKEPVLRFVRQELPVQGVLQL